MRLKGLVITLLVLVLLAAVYAVPVGAQISVPKLSNVFDMSPQSWTLGTYPAFGGSGSLYNAAMPSFSFSLGQAPKMGSVSTIKYSPMFDMSPGAWNSNTFLKFK